MTMQCKIGLEHCERDSVNFKVFIGSIFLYDKLEIFD